MKILVIDDDADQLSLRCLLLSQHGFEAWPASTPQEALSMAEEQRPPLALMDLCLPTPAEGLQLIRDLKRISAEMAVVLLTGVDRKRLTAQPELGLVEEIALKGSPSRDLLGVLERIRARLR